MRASRKPEVEPPGKMREACVVPSVCTKVTPHVRAGSALLGPFVSFFEDSIDFENQSVLLARYTVILKSLTTVRNGRQANALEVLDFESNRSAEAVAVVSNRALVGVDHSPVCFLRS